MLFRTPALACAFWLSLAISVCGARAGAFDSNEWAARHGLVPAQGATFGSAATGDSASPDQPNLGTGEPKVPKNDVENNVARPTSEPSDLDLAFGDLSKSYSNNETLMTEQVRGMSPGRKSDALRLAGLVIATSVSEGTALAEKGQSCSYIRSSWTCTPGYFCQAPSDNGNATVLPSADNRCPPGFLCPADTYQPIYCCPGFFCPTSAQIHICPEGHWCPVGTVQPLPCSFLAYCPEGTVAAPRFGVAAFIVAIFICMTLVFQIRRRMSRLRNIKYNRRLNVREGQKVNTLTTSSSTNTLGPLLDEDDFDDADTLPDAEDVGKIRSPPPALGEGYRKFDIQFHNLGLTLPDGVEIMRGVSGTLKAGRLCAVMGPSGAGKTTFVSLLTNKAKRSEGRVHINGIEEELSTYRKLIGFVPQEDTMLRELSVRDILMHSALMRLPVEWPVMRKKDLVLDTISFLGLEHIMNSTVGDEVERGISGGQRKRVNIGMELVAAPSVLFLDEPTSGLDSATSFEVCKLLHTIAREQSMTIASIIHSPSPTCFEQFDDLLLLGKGGRTIYFGPRDQAPQYFNKIGFVNVLGVSPSDFYMDVATGRVPCSLSKEFTPTMLFSCWDFHMEGADPTLGLRTKSLGRRKKTIIQRLEKKSVALAAIASTAVSMAEFWRDVAEELWQTMKDLVRKDPVRATPNLLSVFWLCYVRACSQLYRSRAGFWFDQLVHLLCGIFISVATFKNDYLGLFPRKVCQIAPVVLQQGLGCGMPGDQLNVSGMFICLGVIFAGVMVGGATFGRERVVFWRDVSSGMPAVPYFLAKWVADIPRILVAAVMFTSSLVLILPFHSALGGIFILVLTLYFCAFSMGYFLSSLLEPASVPLASIGFVLLWSMLFGGVTPDYYQIAKSPEWEPFRFIWAISAPRWIVEAWYIKEAEARPWLELKSGALSHAYKRENYGFALASVFYIALGWAFLALLALKLVNRGKQK